MAQLKNGTDKPTAPGVVIRACIHCRDDDDKWRDQRLRSNSKCDRGPWAPSKPLIQPHCTPEQRRSTPFDCEITTTRRVSTPHVRAGRIWISSATGTSRINPPSPPRLQLPLRQGELASAVKFWCFRETKEQGGNEAWPPLASGAPAAGSFGATSFLSRACGACTPSSHNASEVPCAEILGAAANYHGSRPR